MSLIAGGTLPSSAADVSPVSAGSDAGAPGETVRSAYRAPVAGSPIVVGVFAPPPTPYAAGHRGVDLAAALGATVLAAGAGTVTFAGPVAGRGVVVIEHQDGVSTGYEPVRALVTRGQVITAGEPIAAVDGQHPPCGSVSCLHWGAQRLGAYIDPMSLLQGLGTVRLLPW